VTIRYGLNQRHEEVIREILAQDPERSDRSIARELGIHHSLPNRVRHEMEAERDGEHQPGDDENQPVLIDQTAYEALWQRCDALLERCETAERQRDQVLADCRVLIAERDALRRLVGAPA
jgi:hypothetical protein